MGGGRVLGLWLAARGNRLHVPPKCQTHRFGIAPVDAQRTPRPFCCCHFHHMARAPRSCVRPFTGAITMEGRRCVIFRLHRCELALLALFHCLQACHFHPSEALLLRIRFKHSPSQDPGEDSQCSFCFETVNTCAVLPNDLVPNSALAIPVSAPFLRDRDFGIRVDPDGTPSREV